MLMIGKIIGAFVGDKIAKQTHGVGGATGAALGVVAATVLRRMSLPMMVTLAAAGYVAKKLVEKSPGQRPDAGPPTAL
jgi:hypothetical protein